MAHSDDNHLNAERIKKFSNAGRLALRMHRFTSLERIHMMWNLSLGGAAASLAILLALTQVQSRQVAYSVCTFTAATSMPLWFLTAALYEGYIFLGRKSFSHMKTKSAVFVFGPLSLIAGVTLVACISSLLWILEPAAAAAFIVTTVFSGVVMNRFTANLADWWFNKNDPDDNDAH